MSDVYAINKDIALRSHKENIILETNGFSAKIKHPGLQKFLHNIIHEEHSNISSEDLDNLCNENGLRKESLINFLTKQTGILKPNYSQKQFKTLYIVGENEVTSQLADSFSEQKRIAVQTVNLNQTIDSSNALILYFTKTLDESVVKRFYQQNQDPKNYLITAYMLGRHLIIDNPFSQHFALPCHFCHFERLRKNASLLGSSQTSSWLSYFKQMLKENNDILYEPNLPSIYDNYMAFCIFRFVSRFIDPFAEVPHYSEYSQFWHVNLETMTIFKENGVHWPFCDCQTKHE